MTNLRNEISLVVNGYGDGLPDDVALEAADAILAAIKASVPPLVWKRKLYKSPDQIGYHAQIYRIYENQEDGSCVLSSGSPDFFGPVHTANPEDAKAAANAHHAAQLTDWMMK